jgi:hypothetical protein
VHLKSVHKYSPFNTKIASYHFTRVLHAVGVVHGSSLPVVQSPIGKQRLGESNIQILLLSRVTNTIRIILLKVTDQLYFSVAIKMLIRSLVLCSFLHLVNAYRVYNRTVTVGDTITLTCTGI